MSSPYLAFGILKSMKAIGLLAPEAVPFARFRCASFRALENCAAAPELKWVESYSGWHLADFAPASSGHTLGWLLPLVSGQACH